MKGAKQSDKLKTKRGAGRKKFAAIKKLNVITKKQTKNMKRGKVGQAPKARRSINNLEK